MKKTLLSFLTFLLAASAAAAEPVMTYQGRLKEGNLPVTAVRYFTFTFCLNGDSDCTPISPTAYPFNVENGLFKSTFTVPAIDLSAGEWFLKVGVGPDAGSVVALSPVEKLTFVPYAVYAATAGYVAGAVKKTGDAMTGQLTVRSSTLTVANVSGSVAGFYTDAGNAGGIEFVKGASQRLYIGHEEAGSNAITGSLANSAGIASAGALHLVSNGLDAVTNGISIVGGRTGVGTNAPESMLDVSGGSITVRGTDAALVLKDATRVIAPDADTATGAGISVSTNVYIVGFSSAARYYGDGSQLYGVNASGFSGTLPVANGGTGRASVAADNILYTSGANTFSESAITVFGRSMLGQNDAAGARTAMAVPATDGTDASGSWGIDITGNATTATTATNVSGTVGITNGGTNSGAALSGSSIMVSNGTSIVQGSPGTATTVLHGNPAGTPSYSAVSLAADVTGILPAANGGTGNGFAKFTGPSGAEKTFTLPDANTTILTTLAAVTAAQGGTGLNNYTVGDLLYASAAGTLNKLADVAVGNALISGGVGAAPSYGKIGLTTHVSGTLPVGSGGTGATDAAGARSNLGLGSVDNTSDANKPVSTAQQTALDLKADLASPTFTGTVAGITAAMVGLGNVTNVAQLPASYLDVDNTLAADSDVKVASQKAVKAYVTTGLSGKLDSNGNGSSLTGITASQVGLGSVNNTSDLNKPVSTAQQTALDLKLDEALTSASIFVGDGSNKAAAVAMSGDVTISNAGVTAIGTAKVTSLMIMNGEILNADINAAAGIVDTKLDTISTAGKVSNSATTAASANTASAIVARDASGNFAAGTITAALSGNVTGNVTGNLAGNADTATTATTANSATSATSAGSATTAGNLFGGLIGYVPYQSGMDNTAMLTAGAAGYVLTGADAAAPTWTQTTATNVGNTIVKRDASGNFSGGTISATVFAGSLQPYSGVVISSETNVGVRVSSNVYIVGYSSAAMYYGNGSALSGISAAAVAGGAANKMLYQTGSGVTGFVDAPSAGTVLSSDGSSIYWNTTPGFSGVNVTGVVHVTGTESIAGIKTFVDTVTVSGNAFSVGESTFVVKEGRVGIGTTSPDNALHVSGAARVTMGISANQGTAGSPSYYFTSDTNTGIFNPDTDAIGFAGAGAERMRINTTGVGIGTGTPTGMLTVYDTTLNRADQLRLGAGPNLDYRIGRHTSDGFLEIEGSQSGQYSGFRFITPAAGTPFTISNSGNVGIGAANPDQKLTVSGNISQTGVLISSGSAMNYFASSVTVAGYGIFNSTVQITDGKLKYGAGTVGQVMKSAGDGFVYWGPDNTALGNQGDPLWVQLVRGDGNGFGNSLLLQNAGNTSITLVNGSSLTVTGAFNVGGSTLAVVNGTVGIGTAAPQAALDVVSTGTSINDYAQVWRDSNGIIRATMTANGILYADGTGVRNVAASDPAKLPLAGGVLTGALTVNGSSLTITAPGQAYALVMDGILISTTGAVQTTGPGSAGVTGNARGSLAVDLQATRYGAAQVASGDHAVIAGGGSNTGGGSYSFIGGGENNTASGAYAAVTGGVGNTANGYVSVVSGASNTASGYRAAIAGGYGNTAGGSDSIVSAGRENTAKGDYSWAGGYASSSTANGAFTWSDSAGALNQNAVADRTVFKNRGGFLVTGSTNPVMTGALDRGVFITGNGLVGIATGAPQAALDVVSTPGGGDYAQIWRSAEGTIQASMTATGRLYATVNGDGLGSHVATTTLQMQNLRIVNASTVNVNSLAIGNGVAVGEQVSLLARPPSANYEYLLFVTTGFHPTDPTMVVSSAGSLGLGIASPKYSLDVSSYARISGRLALPADGSRTLTVGDQKDDGWNGIVNIQGMNSYQSTLKLGEASASYSPSLGFTRSRGTYTSPTAVLTDDVLGSLVFAGWYGSGYVDAARITVKAEAGYSGTNAPTRMSFSVLPYGTIAGADQVTVLTLAPPGRAGVGTVNPQAKLHVVSTSTTDSAIFITSHATAGYGLVVTTAASVGIGVAGPAARLDVRGADSAAGDAPDAMAVVGGTGGIPTTGGRGGAIKLTAGNGGDGPGGVQDGGDIVLKGGRAGQSGMAGHSGGDIIIAPGMKSGDSYSVDGNVLIATAAGSVGIGTTNPAARLDVVSAGATINEYAQVWRSSNNVIQASMTATGRLYASVSDATKLSKYGDTMNGILIMNSNNIIGVSSLSASGDISAARFQISGSTVLAVLKGDGSLGVGVDAGKINTGNYNSFVGYGAGSNNTTGEKNSFVGYGAGSWNNTGAQNSFVGYSAGANNTTGANNTFVGYDAGFTNTTGANNTFVGYDAGANIQTGSANVIFGNEAGTSVYGTSISSSTLVGYKAGFALTTGSDNILLGFQAGDALETGSRNIVIGYDQDTTASNTSNQLNIGGAIYGDLSKGRIGVGTSSPQARLDVIESSVGSSTYTLHVGTSASAYSLVVTTMGMVGVNTHNPMAYMHIAPASGAGALGLIVDIVSSPSPDLFNSAGMGILRARGTPGSPVRVEENDGLGALVFMGYDNFLSTDPYRVGAAIKAAADGTTAAGSVPGRLEFLTSPGSNLTRTSMVIKSDGSVGISTGTPQAMLDVVSSATYAQIWRDSGGTIQASMTATGRLYATVNADNLGNHNATQDLQMNWSDIQTVSNMVSTGVISSAGLEVRDNGYTGSAYTLRVSTSADTYAFVVTTSGRVGFGTSAPVSRVSLQTTSADDDFSIIQTATDSTKAYALNFGKVRGVNVVQSGDEILSIGFYGYDNNPDPRSGGYNPAGGIKGYLDGTVSVPGDMPGRLEFLTTPDGTSQPLTRMTIKNDGKIGIGTTTPNDLVTVFSTSASNGLESFTLRMVSSADPEDAMSLNGIRARGTPDVQQNVADGDMLLVIGAGGRNDLSSDVHPPAAFIAFKVDGIPAQSANDMPGRIEFMTAPDNGGEPVSRLVIKNNGMVGISTDTPRAMLDIVSTGTYAQIWRNNSGAAVATMTAAGELFASINTSSITAYSLTVSTGFGPILAVSTSGVAIGDYFHSTGSLLRAYGYARDANPGIRDINVAVDGLIRTKGSGAEDIAAAGDFQTEVDNSGQLSLAVGIHSGVRLNSAASADQVIGLMLGSFENAGTVHETYGIYIDSLTHGTQTHAPYALYSADSNARTYFAGAVGIATATPQAALDVRSSTATAGTPVQIWRDFSGVSVASVTVEGAIMANAARFKGSLADPREFFVSTWGAVGIGDFSDVDVDTVAVLNLSASLADVNMTGDKGGVIALNAQAASRKNFAYTGGMVLGANIETSLYDQDQIGDLVAIRAQLRKEGTIGGATANRAVGLLIDDMYAYSGGATITDTYGIYIAKQSSSPVTQTNAPYALYSEDPLARSYYAGNVGIGYATAPASVLAVTGADGSSDKVLVVSTGAFEAFSVKGNGEVFAHQYVGDGSGLWNLPGDGLGNHVATTTLQMGSWGVITSSHITAAAYQINGSTVLSKLNATSISLGVDAGRLNTANAGNVYVGYQAGANNSGGASNVFVGYQAGLYNGGSHNIYIGDQAGGWAAANTPSDNVFIGHNTAYKNIYGAYNVMIGYQAGYSNVDASYNTFVGYAAGWKHAAGTNSYNTYTGYNAGYMNVTGINNALFGARAGYWNPVGGGNAVFGEEAGYGSNGFAYSSATIMGYKAGYGLTSGSDNVLLGFQAGDNLQTGGRNIIIGYDQDATASTISNELNIGGVLRGNLSAGMIAIGQANTLPGAALDVRSTTTTGGYAQVWRDGNGVIVATMTSAGRLYADIPGDGLGNHVATTTLQMKAFGVNTSSAVTAAFYQINGSTVLAVGPRTTYAYDASIAVGWEAGASNADARNIFMGGSAGYANSTGKDNVFIGAIAGWNNVSGSSNVFVGSLAGNSNNAGSNNIYIGKSAGSEATTASHNVAVGESAGHGYAYDASYTSSTLLGYNAGYRLYEGAGNVFLGYKAGDSVENGTNNIIIGSGQDTLTAYDSNFLNIGGLIYGDLATMRIGIATATPQGLFQVGGGTLTVLASGKVGVGTTNPAKRVEITEPGVAVSIYPLRLTNTANAVGDGVGLEFYDTTNAMGAIEAKIVGTGEAALIFKTGPLGTIGEKVRIDQNGNVGIGTTSPQGMFQVGGGTLTVLASGKVGIGTTVPGAALDVNGPAKLRRYLVDRVDTGRNITGEDLGKTIVSSNTVGQTFTLPAGISQDIGATITFVKLGAGRLTIQASGGEYIGASTAGGTIYNDAVSPADAAVTLRLVETGKWVIVSGQGVWIAT